MVDAEFIKRAGRHARKLALGHFFARDLFRRPLQRAKPLRARYNSRLSRARFLQPLCALTRAEDKHGF